MNENDEKFLRSILAGEATIRPPPPDQDATGKESAKLAEFLKAQGIQPPTPPNRLREQLQQAVNIYNKKYPPNIETN